MKLLGRIKRFLSLRNSGAGAVQVGNVAGALTVNNFYSHPPQPVPGPEIRAMRKAVYEALHLLRDGYPAKHRAVLDFMVREWRTERFMELDDGALRRLDGYLKAVRREIDDDNRRPGGAVTGDHG